MAMQIIVTSLDAKTFRLSAEPFHTILDVKRMIEENHLIPMALQQLVFGEVPLEYDRMLPHLPLPTPPPPIAPIMFVGLLMEQLV